MGPLPGRRQGISGGLFAGVAPLWGLVQGRTRGAEAFAAPGAEPRPRRIRPAAAVTTWIAATQPPVIRCCRCGWLRTSAPFSEPETVATHSLEFNAKVVLEATSGRKTIKDRSGGCR